VAERRDLLTVEFDLTRRHVWGWRWRAMRRPLGTWIAYLLAGTAVAEFTLLCLTWGRGWGVGDLVLSLAAGLVCIGLFLLAPIASFRTQSRKLRIDSAGIQIIRDDRRRFKSWGQVVAILEAAGQIYIVCSRMNAIIIPREAFWSAERQWEFLTQIRRLHRAHHEEAQPEPRSSLMAV
jgi:hypothetical protein